MNIEINNKIYPIVIVKKKNKNSYIRVKDSTIIITTNFFVPQFEVKKIIKNNEKAIYKMIVNDEKKQSKNSDFYYLGHKYDIIIVPTIDKIDFTDTKIFVSSLTYLDKWLKKKIVEIFKERFNYNYNLMNENISLPNLRIRKMKTRWGVCSKKNIITLNSELIKYTLNEIDYVIIHELSHLTYFNHSKDFWNLVSKYCPNYKEYRKNLKD